MGEPDLLGTAAFFKGEVGFAAKGGFEGEVGLLERGGGGPLLLLEVVVVVVVVVKMAAAGDEGVCEVGEIGLALARSACACVRVCVCVCVCVVVGKIQCIKLMRNDQQHDACI